MLRDLKNEFAARFADEILLNDRRAKPVGCPTVQNRSSLNATIGEGCRHFLKYSLVGHVYLFILATMEEITREAPALSHPTFNSDLERKLSSPMLYTQLPLFRNVVSAPSLAAAARRAIAKQKSDYQIGSFYNLIEWRTN